jgi:hypothetical protein
MIVGLAYNRAGWGMIYRNVAALRVLFDPGVHACVLPKREGKTLVD